LQEMLMAFKDVLQRADMFAHHHINRERLSVRQRMSDILSGLRDTAFMEFITLFRSEEGRMGVTVTFIAILELMKEGLIEIVQSEPYAPIHVRPASGSRHLSLVANAAATLSPDAENEAALAQPELPDENADPEDDVPEPAAALSEVQESEVEKDVPETEATASVNESTVVAADTGSEAVTPADDIVTNTDAAVDTEQVDARDDDGRMDEQH